MKSNARRDLALAAASAAATFAVGAQLELNEALLRWTRGLERFQIDEVPLALLVLTLALSWFAWRRVRETRCELALRIEAERRAEDSERRYRLLAREAIGIQEAERRRLAHELHDEMGQTLNAIKIEAVSLRRRAEAMGEGVVGGQPAAVPLPAASPPAVRDDAVMPASVAAELRRGASAIVELNDHVYATVRAMMGRLRPVALDELGLVAALEHCIDGWRPRLAGTSFEFGASDGLDRLPEPISITVYRLVQESLTNIARHAQATRVRVDVTREGGVVKLAVHDDGRGLVPGGGRGGLGLLGMQERVESVGGRFALASEPGGGTMITAEIPVTEDEDA
ncbi:ATP-binding protein [Derxia gummosa]|uniref:Oxygen sensor histidine kinase NreB n=1 Tax=Derxia gummosa DSM 723 TaxID=1121388 RepID=A0A8B6XCN3_9BURK|nr:ATP-binding protein [Derxia gummosa]